MRFGRSRHSSPLVVGLTVIGLAFAATSAGAGTGAGGIPQPVEQQTAADGASIEIIDAVSMSLAQLLSPPGTSQREYVPPNLVTDTSWVRQNATEADRSTNPATNRITPRASFLLDSAIAAGLTRLGSVSCVGGRASNSTSDHPAGRACDLMFDYRTAAGVDAGWRAANWLVANQSVLGVKYVIWQGRAWYAGSRVKPWEAYVSSSYGCPNPANITGCHYDHVHVSVY